MGHSNAPPPHEVCVMAIVPRQKSTLPEWAKKVVWHLESAARLLAENGMDIQANGLDRVISVVFRHVRGR